VRICAPHGTMGGGAAMVRPIVRPRGATTPSRIVVALALVLIVAASDRIGALGRAAYRTREYRRDAVARVSEGFSATAPEPSVARLHGFDRRVRSVLDDAPSAEGIAPAIPLALRRALLSPLPGRTPHLFTAATSGAPRAPPEALRS
jgi:hypothetical protein